MEKLLLLLFRPLVKFVFIQVIKLLFYSFDFVTINDRDKRDGIRKSRRVYYNFYFRCTHHVFIYQGEFRVNVTFPDGIFTTNNPTTRINDGGNRGDGTRDIWRTYFTMKLKNDFRRITDRIVIYVCGALAFAPLMNLHMSKCQTS